MSSPKDTTNTTTATTTEPEKTENVETKSETYNEQQEENKEEDIESKWTPVWDDNAQAYYWWNTETNETTWINPNATPEEKAAAEAAAAEAAKANSNPLDFLLDRIDNEVKKKLDGEDVPEGSVQSYEPTATGSYYDQYYNSSDPTDAYTFQAHFNARTGRFTSQSEVERLNPEMLTIESRATRQMQNYFDVDTYTEQRNAERQMAQDGRVNKRKPLTRKEVEYFKKMKKEKKSRRAREWLLQ